MQYKYCIICEAWRFALFINDDYVWDFSCSHEATEEGQVIVDSNFGKLYTLTPDDLGIIPLSG